MAQVKLKEITVNTSGNIPKVGERAPDFILTANDLSDISLKKFEGKNVILNIFPSIDTRVCAMSVRQFNKRASELTNAVVLCISKDLPFAQKRFCGAEGIENVIALSDFRNHGFASDYGVEMMDGAMAGLHARCVIVIGGDGVIKHSELVPVIGQEPDYDAALKAVQ